MLDPARRSFLAALLSAEPGLLEPIFEVKVRLPETMADKACSVLKQSRGSVTSYEIERQALVTTRVPVDAAFGLSEKLRGATSGNARSECAFVAWEVHKRSLDVFQMPLNNREDMIMDVATVRPWRRRGGRRRLPSSGLTV